MISTRSESSTSFAPASTDKNVEEVEKLCSGALPAEPPVRAERKSSLLEARPKASPARLLEARPKVGPRPQLGLDATEPSKASIRPSKGMNRKAAQEHAEEPRKAMQQKVSFRQDPAIPREPDTENQVQKCAAVVHEEMRRCWEDQYDVEYDPKLLSHLSRVLFMKRKPQEDSAGASQSGQEDEVDEDSTADDEVDEDSTAFASQE